MNLEVFDQERPIPKEGETVCDGCWKVEYKPVMWVWFNFKHLKPQWMCIECCQKEGQRLMHLQEQGM